MTHDSDSVPRSGETVYEPRKAIPPPAGDADTDPSELAPETKRSADDDAARFAAIVGNMLDSALGPLRDRMDALEGAVRHLANETARANAGIAQIPSLHAGLKQLETNCALRHGNGGSIPAGER